MSHRNPSSRSSSSPNVEEKTLLFFSLCWTPRKGLYRSSRHLKPISLARDLNQMLKPKKSAAWEVTNIAKRRVKHHPLRHCLSRIFMSDDVLQCALYSALCSGRFQRVFCESRRKVGTTIPYRTVCRISHVAAQRAGSRNSDLGPSSVHYKYCKDILSCDYKKLYCLRKQWNCTNRSDTFLYDQLFWSRR